jgi:Competence protein CoiA-like family
VLSAKCEPLGGLIYAPEWTERWEEVQLNKASLQCPFSGDTMFPRRQHARQGHVVNAHFARHGEASLLDDRYIFDPEIMERSNHGYAMGGESWEHLLGKMLARDNAPTLLSISSTAKGAYEHRFTLPDGRWRIADVAFLYPGGFCTVIEIQLASITPEELEERTHDYESIGVECHWWFGKSAAIPSNIHWNYGRFGVSPVLFKGFQRSSDSTTGQKLN